MSVALPAPNGMKALIGFDGQLCACAGAATVSDITAKAVNTTVEPTKSRTLSDLDLDLRITPQSLCTHAVPGCYAAFMPWRLCEASLTVKKTTSASGPALPSCTVSAGM